MNKQLNIFLIRHGETEWTISKSHTGLTDIPLTDKGIEQSESLIKRLKNIHFNAVFTSPLQRARQTCQITGFSSVAIVDPLLLEWNYGDYEGLTSEEIHKFDPKWSIFANGTPNGETPNDVSARADQMLQKIKPLKGNIALFSSGHFLRTLAARWLSLPPLTGSYLALSPASLSILGFERSTPVLQSWNETYFQNS